MSGNTFIIDSTFISQIAGDSVVRAALSQAFGKVTALPYVVPAIKWNDTAEVRKQKFLQITGGYISYNWNYRSGDDSSFIESGVSQHTLTGGMDAIFFGKLPVRISYFERQSNSTYFKDFRDVRVDVDVQKYQQLRRFKYLSDNRHAADKIINPGLLPSAQLASAKFSQFNNLLNSPWVTRELMRAKEALIRKDFPDTSVHYRDSIKAKASRFLAFYDTLSSYQAKYERLSDSLTQAYYLAEKKAKRVRELFAGQTLSASELRELEAYVGKASPAAKNLSNAYNGLRSLSLGRTLPNFSNLTLQNVNVNGLNLEYGIGRFYLAAAAGVVDFRIRDFVYSPQKPPTQYVYSGRIGYGRKESNNIVLTYFRGRKQLIGGSFQNPVSDVQGVSVAAQLFVTRKVRLFGEIAQSGVPYTQNGAAHESSALRFDDKSQRAYAIGFSSFLPKTQTALEGYYQNTGLNYQSFNGFQLSAASVSWSFKLEQYAWKRQLHLRAAFRKNDFVNPQVLQRYNSNTVFKNLMLTFRKQGWPVVSLGYLPASQYTAVGTQIFENHYQTVTGTISHHYKLGIAKASSLVSWSKFYNDKSDSGLVYFNSKSFSWNQSFRFRLFTAAVNISSVSNGQFNLIVMEEGLSATLFKTLNLGGSVKINNLNREVNKVGFSANTRVRVPYVGELSVWLENNYLPSFRNTLFQYEMYGIGLTRYF